MASKKAIMSVTPAAQERVRALIAHAEGAGKPHFALKLGVDKGGCAGMSYTMDMAEAARPGDELIEFEGGRVVVDAKAVLYLLGAEMDFETTKLRSGFIFHNPNQTSACGCGESVELKPASPAALQAVG